MKPFHYLYIQELRAQEGSAHHIRPVFGAVDGIIAYCGAVDVWVFVWRWR